jgi:hypothetical protein
MSSRIRPHLTYANVVSTLALFLLVAGGGAYAAKKLKLKNNSVTTPKIKDAAVTAPKIGAGAVTNPKLADGSVTTPKIADSAVNGGKIADNSVTGPKADESSLVFPCSFPAGGAFHSTPGGTCIFTIPPANQTWNQAVAACHSQRATLPTVAQLVGAAPLGGSPLHSVNVWASEVQGGGTPEAPMVNFDANGTLVAVATLALTVSNQNTTIACAYEPASAPASG